ncbi:MAG: PQQ-dependent sugar dehydrogenase [Planctomycetota bacterium]|nr:PQQ-dependent sugar dehydrogenase [Planctomycetota bacterium]
MHFNLLNQIFLAIALNASFFFTIQLAGADEESPSDSPPQKKQHDGWEDLFDGKTLRGWRLYGDQKPIAGWQVIDGALVRVEQGAGDIITNKQFDQFELEFEYNISPGGNSGVMFHVTEAQPAPWMSGPEVQILDNVGGKDPQKSGWLYGLYSPTKPRWVARAEKKANISTPAIPDATRPAGQWNHVYLRVTPEQSELLLNGVRYYRFHKGDEDWNKRVAASKFNKYPTFGKSPKGHICLQDHGDRVAYRNMRIRPLSSQDSLPGWNEPPPRTIEPVPAFTAIQFPEQAAEEEEGKIPSIRPVAMQETPAGFFLVALQDGRIIAFANSPSARRIVDFLDLRDRVADYRKGNEEGLLGLAIHPQFKKNRQLFVYYTAASGNRRSVVSRLTMSEGFAYSADRTFAEQIILEIPQPFANHNGGSIAFGPDGHLYIGLGDGGSQNDPLGNGQNLNTILGSILRIDINRRTDDLPYAIPDDNPFVDQENVRPEIYAYGFRNVWQLSFDTATGDLWAADVGQDRYEEINRIVPGGNYGWSVKEGTLPFGNQVVQQASANGSHEPVWQYDRHHGRSITGGFVYRGEKFPQLNGHYLYADYVSGNIWALDVSTLPVTSPPRRLAGGPLAVIAFARDALGAAFLLTEGVPNAAFYRLARQSDVKSKNDLSANP